MIVIYWFTNSIETLSVFSGSLAIHAGRQLQRKSHLKGGFPKTQISHIHPASDFLNVDVLIALTCRQFTKPVESGGRYCLILIKYYKRLYIIKCIFVHILVNE